MNKIDRRNFIDLLLGFGFAGWLGSVFYPIAKFLKPPKRIEASVGSVKAGKVSEFPMDSGKIIRYAEYRSF